MQAMQLYEQVMEMRAGDTLASLEVEPVMEELRASMRMPCPLRPQHTREPAMPHSLLVS